MYDHRQHCIYYRYTSLQGAIAIEKENISLILEEKTVYHPHTIDIGSWDNNHIKEIAVAL